MSASVFAPRSPTRRSFLKSLLATGVAPHVIPGRALGGPGKTPPSNKITVGVIGVGAQGRGDMGNFLAQDDVRVTAICDVNRRNIERASRIIAERYGSADVKIHADFRELNADPSIDAVLMALPVHWHSIPSADAILRGKHIFHEKPMAMSFREASIVRDAVRKKGAVFQFGTQQRSDLKFRWASELALNGRLGEMREILVCAPGGKSGPTFAEQPVPDWVDWDRWVGPAPMTPFCEEKLKRDNHENITNFSLGMISCWGIHHMDIAQWGNGTDATGPRTIEGNGEFPKEGAFDAVQRWRVRFEFARATPVIFASEGTPGFAHGIRFVGESGWVHVKRGLIEASDENLLRDPGNRCGTMPITLPASNDHTRNFIDAIRNRARAICDIETAVRSDTLCQLALIAVRLGRKLAWDPASEHFLNDEAANRLLEWRPMRDPWALPRPDL
ncbi:MAG TPA: Gfo/Idh/MocA family oxidoreductase [Verrucomicrobiae bacterium]|nr:Gfo/Idh/MocA family oxidoreductase [Verrucomicrobiae bacterium]